MQRELARIYTHPQLMTLHGDVNSGMHAHRRASGPCSGLPPPTLDRATRHPGNAAPGRWMDAERRQQREEGDRNALSCTTMTSE